MRSAGVISARVREANVERHLDQARAIQVEDEDAEDEDDNGNLYGNGNSNGFVLDEAEG